MLTQTTAVFIDNVIVPVKGRVVYNTKTPKSFEAIF